jgi:two-component system chemotaxis sensor kinase CheA
VKVATDRLDALINTVGELVIAQSMVSQDVVKLASGSQRVMRNASHLSKITRELQDLSMSMRMVPIQGVFQKMARLARDVARKAGKEIDFRMTGGETELDRNVVEAISDPLVHMVRNSIDHGVEPPDVRAAAGKPRAGRVEIKAFHEAGNICIEIVDDGRGLNKKKLIEKATAAGILTPGQELSEQEIFKLIFHAGLSTAEKVTDISGRGVGMDVVRKNIEGLRGRIDIASVEGKGATFSIRLPLTLAVIDGLVVRIGTQRYIIPILSVEQSLRPTAAQISTLQNRGEMCMIRGTVLPLFRLYKLFNVTPKSTDPTQSIVVIVQDNDRRCCLVVDELVGQQQVVIKSLTDSLGSIRGISGGAILGDGSISLILDVPGLTELATGQQN